MMESKPNTNENYHHLLINIFGEMSNNQIAQIFANTQILDLKAGEFLFKQGDLENSLYVVLSGRMRAIYQNESGVQQIYGDMSTGEPVGELSLFTKDPRSASVVALRKSTVLQLNEAEYLILVEKFPLFAHSLTNFVIKRLSGNAFQQRLGAAPKNIAIIKLQPDLDLSPWTDSIKLELDAMSVKINVYDFNDELAQDSYAIFEDMEDHTGLNFLVCDEQHPEWADQCIAYCDLILVATDFNAPHQISNLEKDLKLYDSNILAKKLYLVFLHAENAPMPSNTARWFKNRKFDLHLHNRKNNEKDIRRFSRIITHKAVGLVLGGGGAKGFAHVGAAKAMLESGIEFDFVGGTSAGALYGIGLTLSDFDIEKVVQLCKNGSERKVTSNDYHLPFLSLMTGRKMQAYLKEMLGETHLEDIWVNTYCISTDYSAACICVHDTGLARQKLEASIAIPGVFPPVIINRHIHVDGGVMDNLPIEAMYQKPVCNVIAISLTAQAKQITNTDTVPSAWSFLINKFTKKHRYRLPKMPSLLINSLTLNSVGKQEVTKKQVSIYMEMDLRAFGLLDWSKWKELIEKGYQQTSEHLKSLPAKEQFWK